MHYLQFLLFLAPFAAAINFTNPNAGDTLSRGQTYTVTWTSVDTDPTQFDIYLWNFVYYPPFYHYIETVQTSAHTTQITIPCDVPAEDGWQFTAIGNMNVYVIYAQTGKFTIDNTACNSPTVGTNPEACPATSTVVVNGGTGATVSAGVGGASSSGIIPGGAGATVTVTLPGPSTCSNGAGVGASASGGISGGPTETVTVTLPAVTLHGHSTCPTGRKTITRVSTTTHTAWKKTTTTTVTSYNSRHTHHMKKHGH